VQPGVSGDFDASSTPIETVFSERESDLVVRMRSEPAEGVAALTLARPDGEDLPAWTPGAHIDLLLPDGLTRQYSLCGAPARPESWRIAVLHDANGRGGSKLVHEMLHEGAHVRVRGPRNHFPLLPAANYVFIAGGIGITPVLPMMAAAAESGSEFQLFYGGRTRTSMAFADEVQQYGDRVRLWPQDELGLLDLPTILGSPGPDTLVYSCGPEPLLAAVETQCQGWPGGSLHIERFAAKKPDATAASDAFEVVLARSGVTVQVPAGMSIVDAVDKAGISVLTSCLEGVCGTCETAVQEGTPDHRDSLLSQEEREAGDYMMICVSRSLTPQLVLDL
jgi:ferredoxin-NADP reductase